MRADPAGSRSPSRARRRTGTVCTCCRKEKTFCRTGVKGWIGTLPAPDRGLFMRKIGFVLAFIAALLLISVEISGSSGPPQPEPDVLVIHNSLPSNHAAGIIVGNNIMDLLGHFGLKGKLVPLEQYRAGDVKHHRFVFVLGVDDRKPVYPSQLLSDIRNTPFLFSGFPGICTSSCDPEVPQKTRIHTQLSFGFDRLQERGIQKQIVCPKMIRPFSRSKSWTARKCKSLRPR